MLEHAMSGLLLLSVPPGASHRAQRSGPGDQARCASLNLPSKLPPVDQLVDSAGLVAAIAPYREGEFVVSLLLNTKGRLSLTPLGSWAGAPDSLLNRVDGALRPTGTVDAPSVRLRFRLRDPRAITVERSELCAPVSLDGTESRVVNIETSSPPPPHIRKPTLRMRIGSDGTVLEARIVASTGVPELDQEIARTAPQSHFRPALLDGRPVEVWLERGHAELVR
jgi:hypothetical protein